MPPRVDGVHGLEVRPVVGEAERLLLARMLRTTIRSARRSTRAGSCATWLARTTARSAVSCSPARHRGCPPGTAGSAGTRRGVRRGSTGSSGCRVFLIRKGVSCRNLASKALALCLRRLGDDFLGRYGIRPLLVETFVGAGYSGGSLCAAGWTYVGDSAGRGRRAMTGERVPPKAVWLRPLTPGWRRDSGCRRRCRRTAAAPAIRPRSRRRP